MQWILMTVIVHYVLKSSKLKLWYSSQGKNILSLLELEYIELG